MSWLLSSPGWRGPPATFRDQSKTTCTSHMADGTAFDWDRWDIPELRLSQRASLLVLQGLPLKGLLDHADIHEPMPDGAVRVHPGPFFLLRAKYVPFDSIPRLSGVVLARLHQDARVADLPEILGALVQVVLAT